MGWTISIQLVRDRALDPGEVSRLRRHVRASGLASQGYGFAVAPPGASGVIAEAGGKLLSSPDPDTDPHASKLFTALTELRGLFAETRLELADDLHIVGWDGTAVTLVVDPDQELTVAPRDRTGWIDVPARRKPPAPRHPSRATLALPRALKDALNAVRAGGEPGDLSALGRDEAKALLRAIAKVARGQPLDFELLAALHAVAAQVPAGAVVDAALADVSLLDTSAPTAVTEAMERLPNRAAVREAVLSTWRLPLPTNAPDRQWDAICSALLMPLANDPWLIAQLGDEHDTADFDSRELRRRHYNRQRVLSTSPEGVRRLIRRRRRDREQHLPVDPYLLACLSRGRFELAVPTLIIELMVSRDRDDATLALARCGATHALRILQRMLATDQYTRIVALALHHVDGDDATAMLRGLLDHADPFARIRAAQGLVLRSGGDAIPELLEAVRFARAMGIWRHDCPDLPWFNGQLGTVADALARPVDYRGTWPELNESELGIEASTTELPAAAIERMLSPNPDIRRDAIELAHQVAIAAGDGRMALTLARAERLHEALCDAAELSMVTAAGFASRVRSSWFWARAMWRKITKIPFDPRYHDDRVTWDWLEAHVREHVAQDIAPELADVHDTASATARAETYALQPLRCTRSEWTEWNAQEASFVATVPDSPSDGIWNPHWQST